MTDAILSTNGLIHKFGAFRALDDVSISIKKGSLTGLIGPNGAGKTTSFYMIVGLVRPDSGKVFLNNVEITHLPMYKRAQKGINETLGPLESLLRKQSDTVDVHF